MRKEVDTVIGSSGDRQLGKKKSSWSDNATRAKYHETLQRLHGRRTQMFQDVLKDTDVVSKRLRT